MSPETELSLRLFRPQRLRSVSVSVFLVKTNPLNQRRGRGKQGAGGVCLWRRWPRRRRQQRQCLAQIGRTAFSRVAETWFGNLKLLTLTSSPTTLSPTCTLVDLYRGNRFCTEVQLLEFSWCDHQHQRSCPQRPGKGKCFRIFTSSSLSELHKQQGKKKHTKKETRALISVEAVRASKQIPPCCQIGSWGQPCY